MMFHKSVLPYDTNAAEFYESKDELLKKYPESGKVLNVSRIAGIYHHYDEIIPVFLLGKSMYWVDNAEVPEWNFDKITDETSFYLDSDGHLVICFNEGDVAPMYMGCVQFVIPDEVVADIRK